MQKLLDQIRDARLLVIGDVMLDHYVWGDASRISPEAPVAVVRVDRDTYAAGGAANVAMNLRALGVKVALAGRIGRDAGAETLVGLLDAAGVDHQGLDCDEAGAPTIVKTRVMCRNQQLCRLDREADPDRYRLEECEGFIERLKDQLAACDAVILSDYAKGVVNPALVQTVAAVAGDHGCLSALDPKPRRNYSVSGVDILTPNRMEALSLAGVEDMPNRPFPAREVCDRIHALCHPKMLVVTLGAEGLLLSAADGASRSMSTVAREVFDVSGAGDTVIAVFTAARAVGADWSDAAKLANIAAGIVVGKLGTATASPAEILAFLKAS